MARPLFADSLYDERALFSPGIQAGELTFVAADGRAADGTLPSGTAAQARHAAENLRAVLRQADQDLVDVAALTVLLTDYADAPAVADVLAGAFGDAAFATCYLGVAGLEGGCRVRLDAVSTTSRDCAVINAAAVAYGPGGNCHAVRVGDLIFLSGSDAADDEEGVAEVGRDMGAQTTAALDRIDAILSTQLLSIGNVVRTFMFMSDLSVRDYYQVARRERYTGYFEPDAFPANSGIGVKDLGPDVLIRSLAIASRVPGKYVSSPKVRLTPGLFSQSVQVGPWQFIAGQDSKRLEDGETIAVGDLAGQTENTLTHIKHIVEAAGGSLADVVKTTVYLVAGQDRETFAAVYRRFFETHAPGAPLPSGLTMEVVGLADVCLVEIDAVAYVPAR